MRKIHRPSMSRSPTRRQRGVALLVSLLLLVVVTVLTISGMTMANFEVMMATNTQARVAALSQAESALVDAEDTIFATFSGVPVFDWSADTTDGYYMPGDLVGSPVDIDWVDPAGPHETALTGGLYVVEYIGPFAASGSSTGMGTGGAGGQRFLYRVTARGSAGKGGVRYVQSVYATSE